VSYPDPRYVGGGEASAVLSRADAPPDLTMGETTVVRYLATGASTHGLFGLYRWDMLGPPTGPGAHFHRSITESFVVLSGTVRLYDGRGWVDATAGDYLYVPEGGLHGFRNESGEPASMLLLFAPGAPREGYFEGLAEMATSGREISDEERADFYLRHDNHWVD
jgi:mannose-6-phosphate isomerase-like protein (cupin superfamily)